MPRKRMSASMPMCRSPTQSTLSSPSSRSTGRSGMGEARKVIHLPLSRREASMSGNPASLMPSMTFWRS
ncbi:MAG: hypothetical protein A4E29_00310 [Methanomassiliicoccales archaeon PtaB.Bin134]|nr:MAG: hypothetical protein A4E29_00310 [Methanomassiliicoccales archaeon PtaB.Bin134]